MKSPFGRRSSDLLVGGRGKLTGPSLSRLLVRGNDKIGKRIHAFSLPAVRTCPGMSGACRSACYARTNRWRFATVRAALRRNLQAAQREDFADRLIGEISRRGVAVVRIHSSGDFFSGTYLGHWQRIAQACPDVIFFAYTRSWRVRELAKGLGELAALTNVRLWYSADQDTGLPRTLPAGVRVAWLETSPDEAVPAGVDLVFRPRRLRKEPNRRVPLTLVCPADRPGPGIKATTCDRCGICWQ